MTAEYATQEKRWELHGATAAGTEICEMMDRGCERLIIAGSIRRQKPTVGDIEILYVPRLVPAKQSLDLFAPAFDNMADQEIAALEAGGFLTRRLNINGSETFGPKIKLMEHAESGIPVDLFATTVASWWSYLVCRTGPKESNIAICEAAKRKGWKWSPFVGFERFITGDAGETETYYPTSEKDVFDFAGLQYHEPRRRR